MFLAELSKIQRNKIYVLVSPTLEYNLLIFSAVIMIITITIITTSEKHKLSYG